MKNNVIKDKKVLSALTIGISAMMFLQTPVSAYAANNGELDDTSSNKESNESQSENNYTSVTNEAQSEANESYDACVSEEVQIPATEETPAVGSAQTESQEAADIILNGDEENNVPPAGSEDEITTQETAEAVSELKKAATEVKEDTKIVDAAGEISEAKTDLTEAEEANKKATKADKESVEAAETAADRLEGEQGILKTADKVEGIVTDTETAGKELVEKIANAKNDNERKKAQKELDDLIKDNTESMNGQITLYNSLSKQYDKAVADLEAAQKTLDENDKTFNRELGEAKGNTAEAEQKLEAAQAKVDDLAKAMQKVQDAIEDGDNNAADNLDNMRGQNKDWSNVFGKKVETSRDAMKEVIADYYLPQVLGIDLVVDDDHKVEFNTVQHSDGKHGYEKNYTQVNYWYLDENNELKQGIKYFNWDSIAKTDADNQNITSSAGNNNEASTAIVMYEKSEDEINAEAVNAAQDDKAMEILQSLSDEEKANYQRNGKFVLDSSNIKRCKEQGMLRLYSYIDENGDVQYITQFQLRGGYPTGGGTYNDEGDLTLGFTRAVNPDGTVTYTNPNTGAKYTNIKVEEKVTQNQNGLYKNANCLILGDNETIAKVLRGEGGYSFVKENVIDKYGISEETVSRLIADNAKLNGFIDANNSANKQALSDKYDVYAREIAQAQVAVQNASQKAEDLEDAIDKIKKNSVRQSKTMLAIHALKTADIASYFGLTNLTEDEAKELNGMTLVELISKLNEYKKEADEKVAKAKIAFGEVIDKILDDAKDAVPDAPSGDTDPSGGGDTATTPDAVTPPTGGITTPTAAETAPVIAAVDAAINMDTVQAAGGAGVQNGRDDEGNVEITDGDVALAETPDALPVTEQITETLAKKADITDPEVALASAMPVDEEGRKMSWWWIFIIAVLGVTGKKMYEEHMKKEEEKNKNKLD